MNTQNQLIAALFNQNRPTFVAIQGYTSDATAEVANYVLNVGCLYAAARVRTVGLLTDFLALVGLSDMERVAGSELLNSAVNNSDPETASAGSLAQSAAYTALGRNLKIHNETGELYVTGFVVGKVTTTEGTHKAVKSSEKTLVKNAITKALRLPTSKRRNFKFAKLLSVTMRGTTLVLQVGGEDGAALAPNENTAILG